MKNLPASDRFFADIRGILADARQQAYTSVNTVMVLAYWKIGQRIVEEELAGKDRADYGHYLIRNLAKQLGDEFGKGFSLANLKNCRQFFLTFPEFEKGYAVRSQLSWTHYRLIMRVENPQASPPSTVPTGEFIKDPYVLEFLDLPKTGTSYADEMSFSANKETPPNLPLSGEGQEIAEYFRSSPDKGRLGGVSSSGAVNRTFICRGRDVA